LSSVSLALAPESSARVQASDATFVVSTTSRNLGIQAIGADSQGAAVGSVATSPATRAIDSLFAGPVDFLGRLDDTFSMSV
jgi:hypothetical protein